MSNTSVCSPQSNGMAESFVNSFRRDYEMRMDKSNAQVVLEQIPHCIQHYNEVHPHSSLKMLSAVEYRKEQELKSHAHKVEITLEI